MTARNDVGRDDMGMSVRRAGAEDSPAIAAVEREAFGDEGPLIAELVAGLRTHPCGRDHLSFVAVDAGDVIGHTMVTRGRLDAFSRIIDVAILSPLGVSPEHQRRGVGRALVERAVQASGEAGFPVIFLEGDPAYYSRLGWVPGKPLGFRKPSIRIPDAAFQCQLLPGYEPWMTGTLVYPEPFWDLDCVGLRGPEFLAWLAAEVAGGREM